MKETLQSFVEAIGNSLSKNICALYTLNRSGKIFCIEAVKGDISGIIDKYLPTDTAIAKTILQSLSPIIIQDLEKEGEDLSITKKHGSIAVFPLVSENRCIGILVVLSNKTMGFTEEEINTLHAYVNIMSYLLKDIELHKATESQLRRLSVFYELSKEITSVLDLDDLLTSITKEVTRLLNARGCILRLLEDGRLRIRSAFGLPEVIEGSMELSIGEGIPGWVTQHDKPLLVEDASRMPENFRVAVLDVKSVICVPLKVADTIIGTLGLYDKRGLDGALVPFNEEDLSTVEEFASISSIAIEKAWMYEKELQREKEALEDKKRMDILFDSVRSGIITLDNEYRILSANQIIEKWTDKKIGEFIGENSAEVFHENKNICPHCVAKITFETGESHSTTQTIGESHLELTAYPIKDEGGKVLESVIFIRDTTERMRRQEEVLSLYKEVLETKEYLESLIENSADAIVTTDLDGIIKSWNKGAERIYGYMEQEAMGRFIPLVPEYLIEREREYIDRIKKGETIKQIETLRKKKDSTLIEVSMTLSPIKSASGGVIGVSSISRDISERKRIEKELIRRNQELSRLFFISSAMRGTIELDKLLRMVLTAVTMGDGLGFNRAILFLVDEEKNVLKGAMGVGPASPEEAFQIWDKISLERKTLTTIIQEIETMPLRKDSFLDRLSLSIEIPLSTETILTKTVKDKRPFNIQKVSDEPLSDAVVIQQLGSQAYAVAPLISRDKIIGVIWVDNHFNRRPISEEDVKFLTAFSNQIATAVESARLFEQVILAEQELKNIFESISDMVFFNSRDYIVKNINKAVSERLGKLPEEIIGKKCYEVFHGLMEPNPECPHHKTVKTKTSIVEELSDPYLGGTFIISSSPIFDIKGEFLGTVHVARDITEIKELKEQLIVAERMAALGEVAARVAHDIRNPLVSVGGFARRLERKLEGKMREYATIIVNEVSRLETVLGEILSFVRGVRIEKKIVDVHSLIEEVTAIMKPQLEEREIELIKKLNAPQYEIYADSGGIKESLLNIFVNAIHAIENKGTISLKTYIKKNNIVIEIKDTGCGIPEEIFPFIFDPFFTTKGSGSTGLGLTIAHKIIEKHNGRIEVESKLTKGSTFRVFLPFKEGKEMEG